MTVKAYDLATGDVLEVLEEVSRDSYGGNLRVRDIADVSNRAGDRCTFTLRVASSYGPGHRHSASAFHPDRHTPAACWHAHRDVLAAVFARYPKARIVTAFADYRGADGFAADFPATGDRNAGSLMHPVRFRATCHCDDFGSWTQCHGPGAKAAKRSPVDWREPGDDGRGVTFATLQLRDGKLQETGVRVIRNLDLMRCPFAILVPEHYRDDGTCRCDDPEERARMMRDWDYTPADFRRAGIEPGTCPRCEHLAHRGRCPGYVNCGCDMEEGS